MKSKPNAAFTHDGIFKGLCSELKVVLDTVTTNGGGLAVQFALCDHIAPPITFNIVKPLNTPAYLYDHTLPVVQGDQELTFEQAVADAPAGLLLSLNEGQLEKVYRLIEGYFQTPCRYIKKMKGSLFISTRDLVVMITEEKNQYGDAR